MSSLLETTFRVQRAAGHTAEGPALVSPVPFSARYDLDRDLGIISRLDHPLRGTSVAGAILIAPSVQGGVAAGWTFLKMRSLGIGFEGLIFDEINPVMVQGAQAANIPVAAGVESRIFSAVQTGMSIRLDPVNRSVTLLDGVS